MRYFIIAGETSGDLHGSNLIRAIKEQDPNADFSGLGGDKMSGAGCRLVQHISRMAYMGITAVIKNAGQIRKNFVIAKQALTEYQPDVLILIDYPSFNLCIAEYCKNRLKNTKIVYYIPPKIWAWKAWRVHKIARLCDLILGIFPFEPDFYAKYGYRCTYVGNPTNDSIRQWQKNKAERTRQEDKTVRIALLPGSRKSEVEKCLLRMMQAAKNAKKRLENVGENVEITIATAPNADKSWYAQYENDAYLTADTYSLLSKATAAVVNSGTATLETALIGCPETAVYYVTASKYLWWLKPLIFKIPFFTLVNIIAGKEVIRELIAQRFTEKNIENELLRLITDSGYRRKIQNDYKQLSSLLGDKNAAQTAAAYIVKLAKTI